MAVIKSKIDVNSKSFKENYEYYQNVVKQLKETLEKVRAGNSKAIEKHLKRGKLLARQRIQKLLDPDTPFMELSSLAALNLYDNAAPYAGIVTGIGIVSGREVMFIANDATIKGGTYFPITVKKHLRAQEIAEENHLPCVYLVDSGGAFLPLQAEVFPDKEHFG
ncbi:MAG: carboxyl transferase domain-containing protein, partial [Candidatus Hodarchaeales archaeon]